jgi:large subunit ribosomal protein L16
MLLPKRVKYRREHRGKMRGMAKGGTEVHFGEFGLQAQEASWITNRQIEAARIDIIRYIKFVLLFWLFMLRLYP